jgi:hypothetical protein
LTLDSLTRQMRRTFETFIAPRKGKNTAYTTVDAVLSAFSVFFPRRWGKLIGGPLARRRAGRPRSQVRSIN